MSVTAERLAQSFEIRNALATIAAVAARHADPAPCFDELVDWAARIERVDPIVLLVGVASRVAGEP